MQTSIRLSSWSYFEDRENQRSTIFNGSTTYKGKFSWFFFSYDHESSNFALIK